MSEWDGWEELPVGTSETVRQVLERARTLFAMRDDLDLGEKLQLFFMDVLIPYYDCLWGGMDQTAGHIIYRLSDQLPPDARRNIGVYPRAVRREQMFKLDPQTATAGWTTLEEWRREWEAHNKNIPPLQELLPEGITLQLGPAEPAAELEPAFDEGKVIDVGDSE